MVCFSAHSRVAILPNKAHLVGNIRQLAPIVKTSTKYFCMNLHLEGSSRAHKVANRLRGIDEMQTGRPHLKQTSNHLSIPSCEFVVQNNVRGCKCVVKAMVLSIQGSSCIVKINAFARFHISKAVEVANRVRGVDEI